MQEIDAKLQKRNKIVLLLTVLNAKMKEYCERNSKMRYQTCMRLDVHRRKGGWILEGSGKIRKQYLGKDFFEKMLLF